MEKRGRGMGEGVEAEVVRVAASQPSAPPAPASGGGASTTAQASYYQGFTRAKRGHPRQAAGHSIHVVFGIHFIPIGAVQRALFVPESRITNNYWLCIFYYIGVCLSWRETGGGGGWCHQFRNEGTHKPTSHLGIQLCHRFNSMCFAPTPLIS